MNDSTRPFSPAARVLHWLMALMILTMLFVGVGMVATVSEWHTWLVGIHKPLGIAILLLAIVRIAVRWRRPPPPLPADLPAPQKLAAHASHWLLYALMIAMPLIGWAMLSAGGYPVMLSSSLRLPPILPFDPRGVRHTASSAHLARAVAVPDVPGAPGGGAVSRAHPTRRRSIQHDRGRHSP